VILDFESFNRRGFWWTTCILQEGIRDQKGGWEKTDLGFHGVKLKGQSEDSIKERVFHSE